MPSTPLRGAAGSGSAQTQKFIADQPSAARASFSLAWRARLVGPSGPASLLLSGKDSDSLARLIPYLRARSLPSTNGAMAPPGAAIMAPSPGVTKPAFAQVYRVLKADGYCFSFYGWLHADRFMNAFRAAGFRPVGHFSFPKRYTSSVGHVRCQHECGYLLAKGNPGKPQQPLGDVIEWDYTGNKLHPTEKPVSVLLPLIETYSDSQATVLDPFAGSGSTLAAAKTLGRAYVGIELDAKYHAIARRRLMEIPGAEA
jgi:hypothetical protein